MIITSLLDTDLYKFTMQQAVLHQFPGAEVEYAFKLRNHHNFKNPLSIYMDEIYEEIVKLCELKFTEEELSYLSSIRFMKKNYIDFLRYFKLNKKNIALSKNKETEELEIKIKGNWRDTILFEVPILAIISEIYNRENNRNFMFICENRNKLNLEEKFSFKEKNPFELIEFGTRRRFSKNIQEEVIKKFKNNMRGTSNVYFAKKYNLKPMGTMAHEFLQACQQLGPRLIDSQSFAFQKWADEYRGDLGIALTDVIGLKAFLKDFDLYFAKLYDGVRHDSGCPFDFAKAIIEHYKSMNIDPKTKVIVFSDGLTFQKAWELNKEFGNQINCSFGIGTNLTNDVGVEPLQMVIKMVECNGRPVAKISDSQGKSMCRDNEYEKYLKSVFKVEE